MGDLIVIGVIAAAAGLALRSIIKDKKAGKHCGCPGCSGHCSSCTSCRE